MWEERWVGIRGRRLLNIIILRLILHCENFQKQPAPQCIEKKVILVKPPPTVLQKLFGIVIMSMLMMMMTHMMCFADDETREWFLGYMIGQIIEGILNDDD